VRVPRPFNFHDGVLLMELVADAERRRRAAPERRGASRAARRAAPRHLIGEVVRMLCAGVIHGDLSEFNILLAPTAR
jgi:RIO kinase 1